MIEVLFHAYTPLILWTGLGAIALRFLPQTFPRFLGRSLYWVGVPWQIFGLARQTHFDPALSLAPVITIATLGTGIVLSWLALRVLVALKVSGAGFWRSLIPPLDSSHQGTFVIASMLGNTGFVGLGIIPGLLREGNMSWAVLFSVTQNLVGTYGIGVLLASYYGRSEQPNHWWILLRDILTVPTLWAFAASYFTQSVEFAAWGDAIVNSSLLFVIPASFVLMGMRLGQLQGLSSLKVAIVPVLLKVLILPALVSVGTTLLGLSGDVRLSLILMAGTPSAFASLILAEEYNLDRDLAASCIALSTVGILLMIPVWLLLF
ncbi:AEC family transporter [Myxacorys almedinensis]|uniref:AEC family transporter n=1 Tax=Myxacorys almedinensis A TaxID=2690445 RepID=A0A8J7Z2M0_9CYAN|nr:AEC family transporter [Myxacorys almedinensis]NDJ18892.1 AEC family transporter [Myxacorys almedinensis A]